MTPLAIDLQEDPMMFLPLLASRLPAASVYHLARAAAPAMRAQFPALTFAQSAAGRALAASRERCFVPHFQGEPRA